MKQDELKDIFAYVDAHQEEFLQELASLCSCRSVAGDEAGLEQARCTIQNYMEKAGISSRRVEIEHGNAMISAACEGEKDYTVVMYNHYDVVEEGDPEYWKSKTPFQLDEQDGVMYARGVSDDKGPLLGRIQAVRAILATRGNIPVGVSGYSGHWNRTGKYGRKSSCSKRKSVCERLYQCDQIYDRGALRTLKGYRERTSEKECGV